MRYGITRARSRTADQRGVTLAEILAVLAIIGLFVVVGVPAVGRYIKEAKVRAANDFIVADLIGTRYVAVTKRSTDTVNFDTTARTYTFNDTKGASVTRILDGVTLSVTNNPVTFSSDGGLTTTPPTIVVQGVISDTVTRTYTIQVFANGKVVSTRS